MERDKWGVYYLGDYFIKFALTTKADCNYIVTVLTENTPT